MEILVREGPRFPATRDTGGRDLCSLGVAVQCLGEGDRSVGNAIPRSGEPVYGSCPLWKYRTRLRLPDCREAQNVRCQLDRSRTRRARFTVRSVNCQHGNSCRSPIQPIGECCSSRGYRGCAARVCPYRSPDEPKRCCPRQAENFPSRRIRPYPVSGVSSCHARSGSRTARQRG